MKIWSEVRPNFGRPAKDMQGSPGS